MIYFKFVPRQESASKSGYFLKYALKFPIKFCPESNICFALVNNHCFAGQNGWIFTTEGISPMHANWILAFYGKQKTIFSGFWRKDEFNKSQPLNTAASHTS